MNESEYYQQYMQDILARAGSREDFSEEQFLEEMCEFLVDQAVIESYDSAFFKKTGQGIRVDAWDYNKEKEVLSLFICDFDPSRELRTLTQTDVDLYFKRVENFFNKSKQASFHHMIEESLPSYGVARHIFENQDNITKVQFFLLSNALLSTRFKGLGNRGLNGFKTVYDIWDIGRRTRIENSSKAKEDIIIDFTEFVDGGIQYLPASTGSETCESFLMVFPGTMLSEIYDRYGERLLEQNVRTFLQFRGGVNKGIRKTLKNEPEMFFAYNNGLTVTAEETEIINGKMKSVKNLQIVNGGQTTASIFMAHLQDKKSIDLEKVFVQVKMTIIESEQVDEVVPEISKCANTQNKVNSADFFSNHPFHKRMEDFSRRILAPSPDGGLSETYWFYERARGQYANIQAKMTPAQKKKFLIQNPKNQMFTKTDLAKFINSFAMLPHLVSKGAQWNFGKFAEEISGTDSKPGQWDKNELQFNELYFKQFIAKAILFKFLDKNIMKQDWYTGYKANIVTYTIAKYAYLVSQKGMFVDLMSIWKKQNLSEALEDQLLELAEIINSIITDTEENVTQYCKKTVCWDKVKARPYRLNDAVVNELIEREEVLERKEAAKRDQRDWNKINAQLEVYERGLEYWQTLIKWVKSEKLFTDKEVSILSSTLRMDRTPPSEKQCKVILQIEERAKVEGFYYK